LGVVALVLGLWLWSRGPSAGDRRADAVDASSRFAIALTSYDYRHLDADMAKVRSMSLAGFRDEYAGLLGTSGVDALKASRAVSVASVAKGPFVGELTSDEARTVTVVQQRITNKDNPTARTINTRIELYLVRTSQGWKIDRVSSTS
jgi:Mce-associated membrane protein